MMTDLAPICLSTYSRLEHLKKTVYALQQNTLAIESNLYIFSDGPKPGDEEKVDQLRKYLHTITGFKNVNIFERKINSRIANNRGGMKMLLDEFGKIIFLEEDVITAPSFLVYMNQALNQYEKNKDIFSISGYCPPINIPEEYQYDGFFLRRFNAWGFGIWKDRYEKIKYISKKEFDDLAKNKQKMKDFCTYGNDMVDMLKADSNAEIDALDVKAMYAQFSENLYTLYPKESLTFNNGFDGTGIHCGATTKFKVTLSQKTVFNLPEYLILNNEIIKSNLIFRNISLLTELKSAIKNFIYSLK